jgi:hypothetical protein
MQRGKPFKKGEATGRPKGAVNHLTKTVKETVMAAFEDLQNDPRANIVAWGKENPTEFYKIAAKLIPTEISANVEVTKKELPPFMKANESQS